MAQIAARAQPETELIERMEDQHERPASLLVQAGVLLPLWQHSAGPADGQALAGVLIQISAALDEHLADEEEHILPLARPARHAGRVGRARDRRYARSHACWCSSVTSWRGHARRAGPDDGEDAGPRPAGLPGGR